MNEQRNGELFPMAAEEPADVAVGKRPEGAARLVHARRDQLEWMERSLEDLVAEDHRVRGVWAFMERLDLWQR